MKHEYSPGITPEGTAAINRAMRPNVAESVRKIDAMIGRLYEKMDAEGDLFGDDLDQLNNLELARRRSINWLKDSGGLPPGMTEVY